MTPQPKQVEELARETVENLPWTGYCVQLADIGCIDIISKALTTYSAEQVKLAVEEKDEQIADLQKENEQLRNRVNLLSVDANRIRESYDNGYVTDIKGKLRVCREALKFSKEFIDKNLDLDDECVCYAGEACDIHHILEKIEEALSQTEVEG